MATYINDAWLNDETRKMLKPLFGNYRNWVRYTDIMGRRRMWEMWRPFTEGWRL